MSYKSIHERFVSGLNGTSLQEVTILTSVGPASALMRDAAFVLFNINASKVTNWFQLTVDFTLLVLPILLSQTLLSDVSTQFLFSLVCLCGILIIPVCVKPFNKDKSNCNTSEITSFLSVKMDNTRHFITYLRSFVLIETAVAILAVDFKIFPRRLAKAETFGSGLMDTGVGLFVFTNAIVSPEARGKHTSCSSFVEKSVATLRSVKSVIPLLVLGVARMLVVKGVNYQEHVSEYGIHWNFFVTLAVTKVLSTFILVGINPNWSGLISVAVTITYQYLLSYCGLSQYIDQGLDGKGGRHGFIDANREGIISCMGYLAIYLAGVQIGKFVLKKRTSIYDWLCACLILTLVSLSLRLVLNYCSTSVQPISRRMANSTYVIWMVALGTFLLCTFILEDLVITAMKCLMQPNRIQTESADRKRPCLLSAISFNGLFYFLLANIFTGVINMTVATIYTSTATAFFIICIYMLCLSVTVMSLFRKDISTKIW